MTRKQQILELLSGGEYTVKQISKKVGITSDHASSILGKLYSRHEVERRENPNDGRSYYYIISKR